MEKIIKIIIIAVISIIVLYFVSLIFYAFRYGYKFNTSNYSNCVWLFKDSVLVDINTDLSVSFKRKRDLYCSYKYKEDFYIGIWEFKDLNKIDLKDISFNQNISLIDVDFKRKQTINTSGSPVFAIKLESFFKDKMDINLDRYSEIEKEFKYENYKGFFGKLNRVSLSNEEFEHIVLIDFSDNQKPSLVLCYKSSLSFFLIIIRSDKAIEQNIIDIFNLP